MKKLLRVWILLSGLFLAFSASAQIVEPVKWKLSTNKVSDCEYELLFTGTIEEHWHVYSLTMSGSDGPMPANIYVDKSADYEVVGKPTEGKPIKAFDKVFEMDVAYFEKTVTFKQKIRLLSNKAITVKGKYEYQSCTEEKCIFPPPTPFEFKLSGTPECEKQGVKLNPVEVGTGGSNSCYCDSMALLRIWKNIQNGGQTAEETSTVTSDSIGTQTSTTNNTTTPPATADDPWWIIFFLGFLAGFSALLTPCVFPMIPMTVSFFTKRSKDKKEGIRNALIYSLSIVAIYTTLGVLFTVIFGVDALHAMSTNVWFNLFFFVMLLLFAFSFLGAFEIVLPSSFVNRMDAKSDRGGLIGIFFMAFTLALVSFSCTSAFIGPLLFSAGATGNISGPFWGMLGFSTALALPFGLFAAFPGWLNSLPKSGGWLNAVKVCLGFIELALAFKFASNADLVVQAGILTREVFIAIWIAIFGLMSLYLMGWFKLPHDSEVKHLSVTRLMFAALTISFTIYLIPGMWGAPLKVISGFPPPDFYAESPHGLGGSTMTTTTGANRLANDKHVNKNEHCPNDLPCFHDYNEALAYAKKVGKPLMIDFTGWACVNCRKMESEVWPDPEVDKRLRNDVVLVSLYVDDKTELPKEQQSVQKLGNSDFTVNTIGTKWAYLQASVYQTNSQPQYVLIDQNEKMLTKETTHYDPDIQKYVQWLDEGIAEYKKRNGK